MWESILIWIFWVSFILGAYVYFGYPILLAIIAKLSRPSDKGFQKFDEWPYVALLIACYNEEKEITSKLENAAKLDYPSDRLMIVLLNDGSADRTSELIREHISSHPDANIVFHDYSENEGKSATILKGVTWLRENHPEYGLIAFTDANAKWAPDALSKIIAPFSDPKIGSVSGLLRYVDPDGHAAGEMEGLYWKYEAFIKRMSSRIGRLPGANGSIFAMRTEAYKPLSKTRGDDFELPVQALIDGHRSILIEDAKSFESPSDDFTSEYRRKLRIIGQMIPSTFILLGRSVARARFMLAFQLLSHKLLRYLVPILQILLLLSSAFLVAQNSFYIVIFILQILFYVLAITGLFIEHSGKEPTKIFRVPLYFTMVNTASLIGILMLITGRKFRWERNR